MNFDELDLKMRKYEQSIDQTILPELYMVTRIDGRNFSRLTKEICKFEAPFDEQFRDMMIKTVESLMNCGFRVVYGFTQSDEISLLFHKDEDLFGRKVRKFNSILASQAGAAFSLELGFPAVFDCRVVPLPTKENVVDYFQWRQEDAHRNALNAHCYWLLRKQGLSPTKATAELEGKSVSYKNELLFKNGINFNELPAWQKRGVGFYWTDEEVSGYNPILKTNETAVRRRLKVDLEIPIKQEYSVFLEQIIN